MSRIFASLETLMSALGKSETGSRDTSVPKLRRFDIPEVRWSCSCSSKPHRAEQRFYPCSVEHAEAVLRLQNNSE